MLSIGYLAETNFHIIYLTNTIQNLIQGPKFVSDEEIERIKAKIEEDNRAIAALDIKKYGKKINILFVRQTHTNKDIKTYGKNGKISILLRLRDVKTTTTTTIGNIVC